MKGTDQAGSLGIDGINRMVRDIRIMEMSLGKEEIFIEEGVKSSRVKLERSIATKRNLKKGEVISEADIHMLSPGDGFKWSEKDLVIGKIIESDISANEIIYKNHLKND
jgi:sialic acid synthase